MMRVMPTVVWSLCLVMLCAGVGCHSRQRQKDAEAHAASRARHQERIARIKSWFFKTKDQNAAPMQHAGDELKHTLPNANKDEMDDVENAGQDEPHIPGLEELKTVKSDAREWPTKVEGYGLDAAAAKRDAMKRAVKEITDALNRAQPPVRLWSPSEDFVRRYLFVNETVGSVDLNPAAQKCVMTLRVPDRRMWTKLHELDRLERAEPRLVVAGQILAGLILLLVTSILYVRVADRTQGVYTRWLQVAGASLVVAVLAGGWLFLFLG